MRTAKDVVNLLEHSRQQGPFCRKNLVGLNWLTGRNVLPSWNVPSLQPQPSATRSTGWWMPSAIASETLCRPDAGDKRQLMHCHSSGQHTALLTVAGRQRECVPQLLYWARGCAPGTPPLTRPLRLSGWADVPPSLTGTHWYTVQQQGRGRNLKWNTSETTTVPLRCKSATSGLHCLGRPPTETSWPLAAIGGDACEFGPSEKTATEKPQGQVTAATSKLEKMEGVGTTLPPPGSDPDRPAMKRPTRECRTHSRRLVQAGTGPGPGTAAH